MTSLAPLTVTTGAPAGEKTGPAVVLVHGFGSNGADDFGELAAALNAAGRPTYVVDLPAHGSPAPAAAADATTTRVVDAILAVIDDAEGDTVDVVGYSLGSRLSWEIPARSRKTVAHLALGGFGPGDPFAALDYPALHAFLDGGDAPADEMTAMMGQMVAAQGENAKGVALLMEGLGSEPLAPTAETAPKVPTLFLCGDADMMAQGAPELAKLVPDARVVEVPGEHMAALHSAEFRAAVLDFLGAA